MNFRTALFLATALAFLCTSHGQFLSKGRQKGGTRQKGGSRQKVSSVSSSSATKVKIFDPKKGSQRGRGGDATIFFSGTSRDKGTGGSSFGKRNYDWDKGNSRTGRGYKGTRSNYWGKRIGERKGSMFTWDKKSWYGQDNSCSTPMEVNLTNCKPETVWALSHGCKMQAYKDCYRNNFPIHSRSSYSCENPTVANISTCNFEKAMTIGKACARILHTDCDELDLGFDPPKKDCSNVTASKETCSDRKSFSQAVKDTPWCWWRYRDVCKEYLAKHPKIKPTMPDECTVWFDGCNMCKIGSDGTTACSQKYCYMAGNIKKPFCVMYADGRKCWTSHSSKRPYCTQVGKPVVPKSPLPKSPWPKSPLPKSPLPKSPLVDTCDEVVASDMDTPDDKEVCRKAAYRCTDADILKDCRYKKDEEETRNCRKAAFIRDKRAHSKCCIDGKLSPYQCMSYGGPNVLPNDCERQCVADGKFKSDVKDCVRCRGIGDLRTKDDHSHDEEEKRPFDPARVNNTIKEIATKLNKEGETCVRRVAFATAQLKTQIQRWSKNKPMQEEEPLEETDILELAEVWADINEVVDGSKRLENTFEDDVEGKNFRDKYVKETLTGKISDSNKPNICGDEFDALKTAYNAIVDDYYNLPTKLKAQGIQRVAFEFSETDLGSTDLEDSQSLCDFAGHLVSKLKQAGAQHEKRLTAARSLLCTESSKLLKLVSNMANCLHKAKKDAADNRDDQAVAYQAALKFDSYALQRVTRLLYLTKNKCLMKDTPESELDTVSGMFRETLTTKIDVADGASALTDDDKKSIAKRLNYGVERRLSTAKNIMTIFVTSSHRRQLQSRRALADDVHAVTTWDIDFPTKTSAMFSFKPSRDDKIITTPLELSSDPTSGSIELAQPMTPIDDNLPDGEVEETTTTKTVENVLDETVTSAPTGKSAAYAPEATDTGTIEAAVGAVALVCTTVWFF